MTDKETKTEAKKETKKVLSLGAKPKLELKKPPAIENIGAVGSVRQSFSHGRSKTVAVEVKRKKRTAETGSSQSAAVDIKSSLGLENRSGTAVPRNLTQEERETRMRALRGAAIENEQRRLQAEQEAIERAQKQSEETPVEDANLSPRERLRQRELEELRLIQEQERIEGERRKKDDAERAKNLSATTTAPRRGAATERPAPTTTTAFQDRGLTGYRRAGSEDSEENEARRGRAGRAAPRRPSSSGNASRRQSGKLTISQALQGEEGGRQRSVAAMRRRIEREKRQLLSQQDQVKQVRDIIIPEVITVQELANRMAERGADVIKSLMKMGVMATITQSIDADTAELIVTEFGHRFKRVAESDVEANLSIIEDNDENILPRPPVVTVMGHVDHGKTSLLDALRKTDVVAGEAGGITQHIGAYQIVMKEPVHGFDRITFIDTPGHAAFTEMRARGANVTDIVILVVAADDGIMPQTIEAIRHAKAADAPLIVAINKCDLPAANPDRVRQELLMHDVQVEEMGGEVLSVEISAKKRMGLEKLQEAILLQAEMMNLKANPNRPAEGAVVEAKMEKGRGSVATVLIKRGTLHVGDIFVAGAEWGRVRALINDHGENVKEAGPAMPVEILGLNGTPVAGDELSVVPSESRAREISEFRIRRRREFASAATQRSTLEQMMENIKAGEAKEFSILIKADVHGSVEALRTSLEKLSEENTEVKVRVLDAAVGAITESDVTLANASRGMVIGFNVRANPQAREMAKRDGVEIRYYSIIYNVIDDVKQVLSGMLAPELREKFLGYARILQVFNITKVGKVAGCKITEGIVKRGAKVRLLRDDVVIHEGALKTLKRMKDEVKEVREGFECGMAFENYDNIQENDMIECFEIEEIARKL
ncbi:MAG: translation initiation factor IF-2 [Proteobacteria bacterium]|jgi:translation initiation factor IF-2|nr:translation initiation factor IF-2 [Alphaproteobacteria bacterium]NCC02943.1 translation initiation factor IF-2 [Pseudomonadota bacterium]